MSPQTHIWKGYVILACFVLLLHSMCNNGPPVLCCVHSRHSPRVPVGSASLLLCRSHQVCPRLWVWTLPPIPTPALLNHISLWVFFTNRTLRVHIYGAHLCTVRHPTAKTCSKFVCARMRTTTLVLILIFLVSFTVESFEQTQTTYWQC